MMNSVDSCVFRRFTAAALLLVGSGAVWADGKPAAVNQPQPTVITDVELGTPVSPVRFDGDVRDLPKVLEWQPGDPIREIPMRHFFPPGATPIPQPPLPVDPLLQTQLDASATTLGAGAFTTPTRSFPGTSFTGVNPPDTNGDVGANHYIQTVNTSGGTDVLVWDKALPTPAQVAAFRLDTLGTGQCANGFGDPIVLYDRPADRWLLMEFSSSGNFLCWYVSQTPDPVSGGWFHYGTQMPSFPDYPKVGIWSTDANGGAGSYIVTANDGGPSISAFDRGAMLSGGTATFQRMTIPQLSGFGIQGPTPVTQDGPDEPPSGSPAMVMRHHDTEIHSGPSAPGDLLEMWFMDVDWVAPGNTTLTGGPDLDVSDFDSTICGLAFAGCFPQPGSGTLLMPIREVIMNRIQYFNHGSFETLVGSFVVQAGPNDHGGVRWYDARKPSGGAWATYQEGTYAIDSDHRWMSSIAMDVSENIALGYNVVSSTTFPSLRYTGRLADDPLGSLPQGEGVIHAGSAANSSFRYGDYAAMDLDPEDDCTFWFTGMDNSSSSWRTQVASFGFDSCGCDLEPSPLTLAANVPGDNAVDLSWNDADLPSIIEYLVLRSRTPGGPYELVDTVADTSPGLADGPDTFYTDTTVSGGLTYYYIVRASDGVTCKSDASNEASADATGLCTLPPLFAGLQNVSNTPSNLCTLDLTWAPATDECGGPITYNVYRSESPGFTPGSGNLVASGITSTVFADFDQLVNVHTYIYVVRAVDGSNGSEENNSIKKSGAPIGSAGACTTISACAENPFVDVQPDAPTTICQGKGFEFAAVTSGGVGPFSFQWTRNGVDIPGATSPTYAPVEIGTHSYNVTVQAPACPGNVFDGQDGEATLVNAPYFDGITSATNPQEPSCGLDLAWDAGSTLCDGPVRYFVYRDTSSPVAAVEGNLIAAGTLATTFRDNQGLANGADYNYLVRAQDSSTGVTDFNTAEASAFPDGPGSGPQAVMNETFEDAGLFLSDWTVTTGPGTHTCGEWDRSTDGSRRPNGSSGSYAIANNECNPILGRTSTTMTSPPVSVTLANMVSVTLEYDLWYNHNGGETAKVEVFDGASWVQVWQDANGDINSHQVIDVTAYAAGNSAFQVRFDYQDATQDKWFSVDNVQVIALIDVQCSTAATGPTTVPDGTLGTTPLLGDRSDLNGDSIDVSWDATSCGGGDFNLVYGDLANVSRWTIDGAECSLSGAGSHTWSSVPAGDLFFLVVSSDGAGTEGGWGQDSYGGERNAFGDSGQCGTTLKDPAVTCP